MGPKLLVYYPFLENEEPSVVGWNKSTIKYVTENRSKVKQVIRDVAKRVGKSYLQSADLDDIYSEILMYMYKCDDYNISKAIERSSSGNVVSLEGYVHSCIKYCVIRYMTNIFKKEKKTVKSTVNDEGKELSPLDTVADERSDLDFEHVLYDINQLCKSCEHLRYKYGQDLYLIWYIRLLTLTSGSQEAYEEVMNALGITRKEILSIERKAAKDEIMINFAKAINYSGAEEALSAIEEYVYSAPLIKEVVIQYCQNTEVNSSTRIIDK